MMNSEPTYTAKPKRKPPPGSRYYPGTWRCPRPSHAKIAKYCDEKNITLQGFLDEAVDEKMRKLGLGPLYPEDWEF